MDKFEEAFKKISKVNLATHIELWGEPKTEKLYFEAGWQSRQAEVDQLKHEKSLQELAINQVAQANQEWQKHIDEKEKRAHNLYYENANLQMLVEEKDKRIEELQAKVDAVEHVLGCAMIAPKEVFQYAGRIGRALRGEHES